ncbi:MAG: mannosyltransferase [Sphingobium sp. 66-54]|nr:MAG: mannosyltransferase [Sphingobium sp. 66-54]
MIPKLIHFIWVGDESKCPTNCMESWKTLHPDWDFILWGNRELHELSWFNRRHMMDMLGRELNGVADMMRWEILHANGGIVLDADSVALRPLDDHLLDCEAFACWENEIARPGLIAAGYFGCEAGNPFVKQIVRDIAAEPTVTHDMAWKTVGPMRLTESYRKYGYSRLRIYPSHYFIPQHFTGATYDGTDPVYAHQLWGSTRNAYDEIYKQDIVSALAEPHEQDDASLLQAARGDLAQSALADRTAVTPLPAGSTLEALHDPYFVQRVEISSEIATLDRLDVLRSLCEGKRVLHVGCVDGRIADPATSLHLLLEPVCASLDGVDAQEEALAQLAPYTSGRLFSRLEDVTDSYDVVLAPEVMGRVSDVTQFLGQLQRVDATCFLLSVPDAFQCRADNFDYVADTQTFVEVGHPDRNVWYTPYTFANTIGKYSQFTVEKMWFFNRVSLLALLSKSQLRMAA